MKVKITRKNDEDKIVDEQIYEGDFIKLNWYRMTIVNSLGFREVKFDLDDEIFITK